MKFNRTKNARRIMMWGIIAQLFSLIVPFVMRTIIIYTLGNLYTGLHSLFNSILNALNLAELGIGSALVFSMYKPVAEDDVDKLSALLKIYKYSYLIIGFVVACVGACLVPFLPSLIKGDCPADVNLVVIYLIQLASTSFGYFFMAYKSSLLSAYQRRDIIYKVTILVDLLMYSFQAVVLIVFRNYYVFIAITLVRQVIFNLVLGFISDKKYPKIRPKGTISSDEKKIIFKKTSALVGHKVADVVINSIDNLFISFFIGLEMVTFYNNYFYIVKALFGLFLIVTNGLHAVVGNYLLTKSKEDILKLFGIMHFVASLCICICCVCLLNCFQPFMIIWVGENSLFPLDTLILFVLYFFFTRIKTVGLLFKDSAGLWEKDLPKVCGMVIIDLVLDIVLLQTIGINGALISTIVSMIFAFIYEMIVIFKYCFKAKFFIYCTNTLYYALITTAICFLSYFICSNLIISNHILILISSLGISVFLSLFGFVVCTFWTREFKNTKQIILKNVFNRK